MQNHAPCGRVSHYVWLAGWDVKISASFSTRHLHTGFYSSEEPGIQEGKPTTLIVSACSQWEVPVVGNTTASGRFSRAPLSTSAFQLPNSGRAKYHTPSHAATAKWPATKPVYISKTRPHHGPQGPLDAGAVAAADPKAGRCSCPKRSPGCYDTKLRMRASSSTKRASHP